MIAALVADLHPHSLFPLDRELLGRPLAAYPLLGLQSSREVRRVYVMTDDPSVKTVTLQFSPIFLDPPEDLPSELGSLIRHCLPMIHKDLEGETPMEFLAVLLLRAPFATGPMVDEAVELLRSRPDAEAALTVSSHPSLHPRWARKETPRGLLEPAVPSPPAGEIWYPDGGLALLRRGVLDKLGTDSMITKALPIKQQGATPVIDEWQVPAAAYWLSRHGVSDLSQSLQPQPKPLPQSAPKGDRR